MTVEVWTLDGNVVSVQGMAELYVKRLLHVLKASAVAQPALVVVPDGQTTHYIVRQQITRVAITE